MLTKERKQEMFDTACAGFEAQGWAVSLDTTKRHTSCVYYDPETGYRCAAGHLLTEEQAERVARDMPGSYAGSVWRALGLPGSEALFARELQSAHDNCADAYARGVGYGNLSLKEAMVKLAMDHGLEVRV